MLRLFILLLSFFLGALVPALAQAPVKSTKTQASKIPSSKASKLAAAVPPTKIKHVFDILRDGNKIGTDVLEIEKDGDKTVAKISTHISVTAAFLELYHFDHSAVETWNAGRFVSYKAHTNDNGTKYVVSAVASDGKTDLTVNGEETKIAQVVLPASLWNADFINSTQLIDADKGKVLSIQVSDLGDDVIEVNGAETHAHHYKITGDFPREVWLVNDEPVRIKLWGSDHSLIVSDLKE